MQEASYQKMADIPRERNTANCYRLMKRLRRNFYFGEISSSFWRPVWGQQHGGNRRVELDKGHKWEIREMQRQVQELARATMGAQELNRTELSVVQSAAEAALDAVALNTGNLWKPGCPGRQTENHDNDHARFLVHLYGHYTFNTESAAPRDSVTAYLGGGSLNSKFSKFSVVLERDFANVPYLIVFLTLFVF